MRKPRAFLLYVEPTPYIEGLIKEIQRLWSGDLDVCYIAQDQSQDWKIDAKLSGGTILPVNRWRAITELRRSLGRLSRGDVVHLAGWGHPLLVAALLMGKLRGLRVFIESDTAAGQAVGGWKCVVRHVVYPPLFRLADHFLPGGKRQAAYLASYGVPNTKTTTAQMTVDVASIMRYVATAGEAARDALRARLGYANDIWAVLYLGRLEPMKGVSDLLVGFAGIASRRGDVRLMIAGSGSLDSLVKEAAAVNPHISYLGQLSGTAVLDAYLASDIVVAPSRFEPWGLVVNEAMACGRPIVATDRVGCIDDLVAHGQTGFIVPAEAPHALSDALELLVSNDRLREEMGAAATRRIAPWTLQNEAEIVVDCWNARCHAY
ncbi:MAG: glycosyltransferase family 4 protein [Candidatus Acidiferrales bacterium]